MSAITVLHTEWSDGWGGQEIRIINEMVAVRARGVKVMLACRGHAVIHRKALEHGFTVFALPFRGSIDLNTLFRLLNIFRENHIDIVNTHSGKDTWVGGFAAKPLGVKFIRTRHLSNPIKSSRVNFINEFADCVITTGESIREAMIADNRINPDKIISIPTGVDTDAFDPARYCRAECRQLFKLADDEIAIGIVAVIRGFKRHDLFVSMARMLLDCHPNKKFKFFIAGGGPGRVVVAGQINKLNLTGDVSMLGHIDNVSELLMALDILVLSSDRFEGVPQSVTQALAMNKAVVATDVGSVSDLHRGDNMRLVKAGDHRELARGVEHYFTTGNFRSDSRDMICKQFSIKSMAEEILGVYQKITDTGELQVIKQ